VGIIAGPVIGLFDAAPAGFVPNVEGVVDADGDVVDTDEVAGPEETRSLIFIVCGPELVVPAPIEDPMEELIEDMGFVVTTPAADAEIGWAAFAASIFLSVSSTSPACHPALVSVALMLSRETPSFI
jgi:hypothetical protein